MTTRPRGAGSHRPAGPGLFRDSGPFPSWVIDWSRRYTGATVLGPKWADTAAPLLTSVLGRPRPAPFKDAVLRYTPYAMLRLDDDPAFIGAAAQKLQNADVLLLGLGPRNELVIQAADFKARLIFADPKQVSADSLRAFLTVVSEQVGDGLADLLTAPEFAPWKGPRLRGGALLDALLNAEGKGVTLVDGAFVVPEGAADRAVLQARGWPNGHLRVIWLPADPRELFGEMPGGALLEPLAALDGDPNPYRSYDTALPYYDESCAALALLMELTSTPGQKHLGFDPMSAAATLAPWIPRADAKAAGSPLRSVAVLAPMVPEAEAHRKVRSDLEALLQLPLRLRNVTEVLNREGTPVPFTEVAEPPAGSLHIDAAREVMREISERYRDEMRQVLAELGPNITPNDVPRMTKRAEALRAVAQERAVAGIRTLAAARR